MFDDDFGWEYNSMERDDDYNVFEERQLDLDREWDDDRDEPVDGDEEDETDEPVDDFQPAEDAHLDASWEDRFETGLNGIEID
jgi:hypothetical protein